MFDTIQFIYKWFVFIHNSFSNLVIFAEDDTISAASKDIESLQEILKSEFESAINWFETNYKFANPDKFQARELRFKFH